MRQCFFIFLRHGASSGALGLMVMDLAEQSIIDLILEMKQRNPSCGYRRIAMRISNSFGVPIDKDSVRRVLSKHYKNNPEDTGPSWLTFIGHMKDSLWSIYVSHYWFCIPAAA